MTVTTLFPLTSVAYPAATETIYPDASSPLAPYALTITFIAKVLSKGQAGTKNS